MSHESKIVGWLPPQSEDMIRAQLERARGGDATDLAALQETLDRYPEIWRSYGDLAKHARDVWIGLIGGEDLALKESLGRQAEAMKADLAGPAPSPLETLLIERIVTCWVQLGLRRRGHGPGQRRIDPARQLSQEKSGLGTPPPLVGHRGAGDDPSPARIGRRGIRTWIEGPVAWK